MAELNPRIIKKIKNSDSDEAIKDFLIELLELEFNNYRSRWSYSDRYDESIEKFSLKYKGE